MEALTPAERRGAMIVVVLLAIGAGHDLWRATRPLPSAVPDVVPPARVSGQAIGPAGAAGISTSMPEPGTSAGRVDLNRATARELDALPGIGPVLAARIIDHREHAGRFRRIEDLLAVRGIGPRLFERLRPRVIVAATPADTTR